MIMYDNIHNTDVAFTRVKTQNGKDRYSHLRKIVKLRTAYCSANTIYNLKCILIFLLEY